MIKIDIDTLVALVKPVTFYQNKAKYIKETSAILRDQYDGDVPKSRAHILSLPGCGKQFIHIISFSN